MPTHRPRPGNDPRHDVPAQRSAGASGPPASSVVRVVIVDDTPDILQLLRMTFDFYEGVEVVGEARTGLEAVELWRAHRPDVVVLDLRMPVMSGLEAAAVILAEAPTQRVVLFSAAFRPVDYQLADAIGVARCLDKRDVTRLPELVQGLALSARQV